MASKERFSKLGVLAAATGSAVGLGNIWKFPLSVHGYGEGGGSFVFLFCVFSFTIGICMMLGEFILGRAGRHNAYATFQRLSSPTSKWKVVGIASVITAFLIMSFYAVVGGWTLRYLWGSVDNLWTGNTIVDFGGFVSNPISPLFYLLIFMIICHLILVGGIKNGIEKYTKILMPILFVAMVVMDIYVLFLDGVGDPLKSIFIPNFSAMTPQMALEAMGQAFFSLSVASGIMLTYGAFIKAEESLPRLSFNITFLNTIISILAAILILPIISIKGLQVKDGTGLAFTALPQTFADMTGGVILEIMFFFLLFVAAITSAISLTEVVVVYVQEQFKVKKSMASMVSCLLIFVFGVFCSLSLGILDVEALKMNFFDWMVYLSESILLPLVGVGISVFIGWVFGKEKVKAELHRGGNSIKPNMLNALFILFKYFIPISVVIVFVIGLIDKFK